MLLALGSVGAMISVVMGVGIVKYWQPLVNWELQCNLTNIARDVGEDARNSRLYLPESWMRQVGLNPDKWLEKPVEDIKDSVIGKKIIGKSFLLLSGLR